MNARLVGPCLTAFCILVLSACEDSPTEVEEPPALPEAAADQVGFPLNYATLFQRFWDGVQTRRSGPRPAFRVVLSVASQLSCTFLLQQTKSDLATRTSAAVARFPTCTTGPTTGRFAWYRFRSLRRLHT